MARDRASAWPLSYFKFAIGTGIVVSFWDYKRRQMLESILEKDVLQWYAVFNQRLNKARPGDEENELGAMEYLT